jgi:hypothetical protein
MLRNQIKGRKGISNPRKFNENIKAVRIVF